MQQLDVSLDSIGYIYSRQLLDCNNSIPYDASLESLCHFYDILVHDPNTSSSEKLYQHFLEVITSPSSLHQPTTTRLPIKREYVKNDERRQYLLGEFIMTEASYLSNLKTFIRSIVEPLKARSKDRQRAILGQYECSNIFMNVEELAAVTESFYNDLINYQRTDEKATNLGDLCLSHLLQFTCYNRFLLGVHNARTINDKQLKNPHYSHFMETVTRNTQTVYDYLALPSQRVGRYTMYFKELMKHTPDDHPDLPGLHGALLKTEEIANMTEEIHTQIMKIFRRLLQAVQYCPESLISFQRRFLCYLDTAEVDPITMKPLQPMTLFLFSDKIMVAKRPSYDVDGLDLCGLDQRMYPGSNRKDFVIKKEAITGKMKFIGWASLNDIDIHGLLDNNNTFTLLCNNSDPLLPSADTDQTAQKSLEAYFLQETRHTFAIFGGNRVNREYFQSVQKTRSHFIHKFGQAKTNLKTSDELIISSYCQWQGHHFFANIYPTSRYHNVSNKSEIALFYIETNTVNIESILNNCFIAPNMVGFIVPHEKDDNYRFAIRSKCTLGNTANEEISLLTFRANDSTAIAHAQNQLLGNLMLCDRDLLKSSQMATPPISTTPSPQPSRFSLKQELIRKKSKSTFKLFSSLTNGSQSRPSSAIIQSRSSHSEYMAGLEASDNSVSYPSSGRSSASSSTSSVKSQHSLESKLTLQYLASSFLPEQSSSTTVLGKLAATESSSSISQQTSYFSPSFHPSRSVSHEIKSNARKSSPPNIIPDYTNTTRSRSPLNHSREPTPAMMDSSSSSSSNHSRYSSISTVNSNHLHYRSSLYLYDIPQQQQQQKQDNLFIPIAPYDNYIQSELEEKNKTVLMLSSLLQKRDQEIDLFKAELDDAVSELGTVCDKFNTELQQLSDMYKQPEWPANPSPNAQLKHKLETTLIERNQWQLRAKELEHQLKCLILNTTNSKLSSHRRHHSASNIPKP